MNKELLEAALAGLEHKRATLDQQIAEVRRMLGGQSGKPQPTTQKKTEAPAPKKRQMSAAGRRRIAEAARKRWAEYKKNKAASS